MGYHLCTYIRKEYGLDAFNSILEISADFSFTPLILNIAVRKVTGEDIETIYSRCLDDLEKLWEKQLAGTEITEAKILSSPADDNFENRYPLGIFPNGKIAVLKSSMDDIYRLVEAGEDGTERLLRRISPFDENISFNGSEFCWAEIRKDARWGEQVLDRYQKIQPVLGRIPDNYRSQQIPVSLA